MEKKNEMKIKKNLNRSKCRGGFYLTCSLGPPFLFLLLLLLHPSVPVLPHYKLICILINPTGGRNDAVDAASDRVGGGMGGYFANRQQYAIIRPKVLKAKCLEVPNRPLCPPFHHVPNDGPPHEAKFYSVKL